MSLLFWIRSYDISHCLSPTRAISILKARRRNIACDVACRASLIILPASLQDGSTSLDPWRLFAWLSSVPDALYCKLMKVGHDGDAMTSSGVYRRWQSKSQLWAPDSHRDFQGRHVRGTCYNACLGSADASVSKQLHLSCFDVHSFAHTHTLYPSTIDFSILQMKFLGIFE